METLLKAKAEPKFKLEHATAADREALISMYESFEPKGEAFGLPPRKEPWRWLDSLAGFPNLIVKVEGRIVGHGVLCVEGDKGETAIFVHQNWRSRGLGRLLLQGLIEEARQLGLRRVWGMADISNVVMLRLAESLGFAFSPEHSVLRFDLDAKTDEESENIPLQYESHSSPEKSKLGRACVACSASRSSVATNARLPDRIVSSWVRDRSPRIGRPDSIDSCLPPGPSSRTQGK